MTLFVLRKDIILLMFRKLTPIYLNKITMNFYLIELNFLAFCNWKRKIER